MVDPDYLKLIEAEAALIATTPEGRVLYWSRAAETAFGRSAREAEGRPLPELFAGAAQQGADPDLIATMSHELRTPLNCILGFTEFLIDGKPGPLNEKQAEYLNDVHSSARHLLQLINDVLDLSKPDRADSPLKPERFAPAGAVEEVCAVVNGVARRKRVDLRCTAPVEMGEVNLDRRKFKQVCYCVLLAAVKCSQPGDKVEIITAPAGPGQFQVRARCAGAGIDHQQSAQLFQHRAGAACDHQSMDLAWAKKTVERQGGTIDADTESAHTLVFTITMPVDPEANSHG